MSDLVEQSEGIDPVCAFHGLRWSEHELGFCLFCCLCFRTLELEDCNVLPDGKREDICRSCARYEGRLLQSVIWWLWTVFDPPEVHTFDVAAAWTDDEPDVAWLGEGAWVYRSDTMGLSLR